MEQGRGEEIKGLQLQVQAQQEDQRGGGGGIIRQNPKQHHHPHQPPPAQPQKCPRCDSSNTKFCYYNNYSLSQPRYFCKTCRRYWTQGGTLRNVPVGGGCRKGKRLMKKPSSSSSGDNHNNNNNNNNSSSHQPNQMISSATSGMGKQNDTISAPFQTFNFPGGGFLSSYGGIQNFSGDVGGSNLGLLQGFAHPSFLLHHQPQQHHQQHHPQQQEQEEQPQNLQFHQVPTTHVFNMGSSREILEENAIQQTKPSTSRHHHQDWSQSFNNTSTNTSPIMMNSDAGYWSNNNTNTTSTTSNTKTNTINNSTSGGGGGSLNLNQTHPWVDLPGFGAPLPSTTTSSSSPSFL